MMQGTILEMLAQVRTAELAPDRGQPERPSRPGAWRRRLARGLVGVGQRLDGEALRTVAGRRDAAPRLRSSDA